MTGRRRIRDDSGQSLILVMMIGLLTLILLGTATTALTTQIRPAKASQDDNAAQAAAEAGVEDFIATVNLKCPPTTGFSCTWLTKSQTNSATVPGAVTGGPNESFVWKVLYTVPGVARVQSVGTVTTGPTSRSKTLVADVLAAPNFNNFEYYTKYETYSPDFIDSFYGPRSVQVTNPNGSSLTGTGVLNWNGVCTYVSSTATPTCDPNHDSGICNDLYYSSGHGPGRGTDSAWNNAMRRPDPATQAAMGTDSSFAYFSENGTYTSGSTTTNVVHNDTCDSSFEPNMVMNGPIYSQDAYLVDRGLDTGQSKNSMPVFTSYAYSLWDGTINGSTVPLGKNGGHDRAYPGTDGQIYTSLTPTPVYTTNELDLPANADGAKPLATCIYTGPTRILVQQSTAYITSPGTAAGSAPCYQSTGSFATASGSGVVNAAVPIGTTLIYVQNPTATTHPAATATSRIFDLKTTLSVPANSSGNTLAGTWTDDATYSASAACPSPADPTKRRNFDCETTTSRPAGDELAAIKAAVNGVVAGATANSGVATALTAALVGHYGLTATQPSSLNSGATAYVVSVGAAATSTSTVTPSTQSDAFFQSTAGTGYSQTVTSWPVTITRYSCNSSKGSCASNKQTATSILTTASAANRITYTSSGAVNSTAQWPWFGSGSYTDPNNDITQYPTGYGDVYLEGTLTGNLTVVAEHDIVVTNNTTYTHSTLATTTDGLALIADHNVRIYRPMTCTDTGTAGRTSPGYCPNDLTGVFTQTLAWPLPNTPTYPFQKYVLDNAPSLPKNTPNNGSGSLYATIFTLRGSFMVDNFYRGEVGTGLDLYGGLYQYHRGPTSLPYQNRPYQGSNTKMPGITLTYNYDNMRAGQAGNGGLRVPWLPPPSGSISNRTWNVVALATG